MISHNQYSLTLIDNDFTFTQTSTDENINIKFHEKDLDVCEISLKFPKIMMS